MTPRRQAATARFAVAPAASVPPVPRPSRRRWLLPVAAVVLVAVVAGAAVVAGPAVYLLRPTSEATPAQRALLAVLPVGYGSANCVPAPEREGGRVDAAVTCVGGPANGPSSAVFLHYVDEASLRDAQLVEITARGLPQTATSSCAATGPQPPDRGTEAPR